MNIEELAFKDRIELANLNEIDLLDIIEFLQKDRKQWINQFSKTHNEGVEIQKENQELKEKFKATNKGLTNAVLKRKKWKHKYELGRCKIKELKKQLEEKQNPLKGIFAQVNDDTLLRDCGAMQSEINGYKNQQKEFIKYLKNQLKLYKEDMNKINAIENPYKWDEWKDIVHEYEVILRKYKEIIGVSDENIIK